MVGGRIGFQALSNWATVVDGARSYRSYGSQVGLQSLSQAASIDFILGF